MKRFLYPAVLHIVCVLVLYPSQLQAQESRPAASPIGATAGVHANLAGHLDHPLRYHPENGDFVIENGQEFFNRSLYGGNTAFRVDGGDKPEFVLYLPGRGGNLRFAFQAGGSLKWLNDAATISTHYRPGELIYHISDPAFGTAEIKLEVLAYADTEGLIVRASGTHLPKGAQLIWAYGGVNGQRGTRDGDIGTEPVPISQYFQFQPGFAADNRFTISQNGFTLNSKHATIVGIVPAGTRQHLAPADRWNDLVALVQDAGQVQESPVIVGTAPISDTAPLLLSLQRVEDGSRTTGDLAVYRDVTAGSPQPGKQKTTPLPPAYTNTALPAEFAATERHFDDLRTKVQIKTPDPYLDTAVGALNIVADALWDTDAQAIMHGAIAWRTKLVGWRGPYVLDALGWHDRARQNFETWFPHQNTNPIGPIPPPDRSANLSRNEAGLHSNGDISNSHYDMNMVFIDALGRHLLWTGDTAFAREAWPIMKRHLVWEKRLFRHEYGPNRLPLYEAYATIWASDDLYYSGGGTAYASAYNAYANRMAARIAAIVGEDPRPYVDEAEAIEKGMRQLLWLPKQGAFAEYKDLLGSQMVHPDYGLWTFYHTVDEEAAGRREAWQMGADLETHLRPIPVEGPGVPNDLPYHVFSETDWMPYSWSINNVVMDENMHTALALWESGHRDDAYVLAKGALLASMYMGISPGNVGTMNYLDVYRRESQRDFADSAGTMSRGMIEGLFGIHPDALSGTLTVTPGFPKSWTYAHLKHPDISIDFTRKGTDETWNISPVGGHFRELVLRVPASFTQIQTVTVNGTKARWRSDPDAVGGPMLEITSPAPANVRIHWAGEPLNTEALSHATTGGASGDFTRTSIGAFTWWDAIPTATRPQQLPANAIDWRTSQPGAVFKEVDLSPWLNDRVTSIFKPEKYLAPRSPGVSLALPWQGAGAWAGHVKLLPEIDDSGLRAAAGRNGGRIVMPNGVTFATSPAADTKNILFTSQWSNYPREVTIPLSGRAKHAYLLMAGSTNFMQSRIDNGEVVVKYTDGTSARLALRNPETWWPIEQDYFIDDYQFPLEGPLPPRIDMKTGQIRILDSATFKGKGREVPGGAATALHLSLDPTKQLQSLTLRTLTNDVVIGLMSLTLELP